MKPSQCWRTPKDLFKLFDNVFHFDLDAYADESNALCADFNSEAEPGKFSWTDRIVFANPPFTLARQAVKLAVLETPELAVLVLPVSDNSQWFHKYGSAASMILRPNKRIQFDPPPGVKKSTNRGDTQILIYVKGFLHADSRSPNIRLVDIEKMKLSFDLL